MAQTGKQSLPEDGIVLPKHAGAIVRKKVIYNFSAFGWLISTYYIIKDIYRCVPGSPVGIELDYGVDGPGIESRWGARFFAHVHTGPGAHPASSTIGTGSFPGLKPPGRGADHPPPSSAEVENG
jgi:hypothetical protein